MHNDISLISRESSSRGLNNGRSLVDLKDVDLDRLYEQIEAADIVEAYGAIPLLSAMSVKDIQDYLTDMGYHRAAA